MSMSPERRAALVGSRLASVVAARHGLPAADVAAVTFGADGAAVVLGDEVWVDPGDLAPTAVGVVSAWALRHGHHTVHLVLDAEHPQVAGTVARQAAPFDPPASVWTLDGATLVPVDPAPAPEVLVPPPATAEHVLLLEQAGLDVVVEGGEVTGEIRGLEVARVVVDADGTSRLDVGVGRFDQEAGALLHGELSPPEALARVVELVADLRRPGAEPHPLNRWARERWLRHQVVTSPELVGAAALRPVESTQPRQGVRETAVAAALGHRPDGAPLVVACSVGIDLHAVPLAADIRACHVPDADLVVVVPTRDRHGVTVALAERLARPAEVLGLDGEWPG